MPVMPSSAADLGRGRIVGRVTNTSGSAKGRKLFVTAGKEKWALHLSGTQKIFHAGRQVSVHDIDIGTWINAEGRRIGKLRLMVERLDIAGDRAAYVKSRAYRKAEPLGYYQPRVKQRSAPSNGRRSPTGRG